MANDVFINLTSTLPQVRNIGLASDWTTDDFHSLTGAPARKTLKLSILIGLESEIQAIFEDHWCSECMHVNHFNWVTTTKERVILRI